MRDHKMLSVFEGRPSSVTVPVKVTGFPKMSVCANPGSTEGATFTPLGVGVAVGVVVGVAVGVGVFVGVEVAVGVGVGVGGSPTVIVTVVLPVRPEGSLTVSFTANVPANEKALLVIDRVEVVPSGNSHRYVNGSFCGSVEVDPSKLTVRGGVPETGDVLILADGAVLVGAVVVNVN